MLRSVSRACGPRRCARTLGVLALVPVAWASLVAPAAAHDPLGPRDLPLPEWAFLWIIALLLLGLQVWWLRGAGAATTRDGRAPSGPDDVPAGAAAARVLRTVVGLLGIAVAGVAIWAGSTGTTNPQANLLPTVLLVGLLVALPVGSMVVGDVWRWLSPWGAVVDAAGVLGRRLSGPAGLPEPFRWPERWGSLPAAAVLLGLGWIQVASPVRDDPPALALMALVYAALLLVGTGVYGRAFLHHADGFALLGRMGAALSPWTVRHGRPALRRPGAGLAALAGDRGVPAGAIAIAATGLFDGVASTTLWSGDGGIGPRLEGLFVDLGVGPGAASTVASTVGLLLVAGLIAASAVGLAGLLRRTVGDTGPARPARPVHPVDRRGGAGVGWDSTAATAVTDRVGGGLVPVALAILVAHYGALLVTEAPTVASLLSDPRGDGSDWFGTASHTGTVGGDGAVAVWLSQIAIVTAAHIGVLVTLRPVRRGARRAALRVATVGLAAAVASAGIALWLST
ncbi:MAG: hypothetical protein AB7G37_04990 [Solirubrobacteraceae bacterium]